MPMTSIAQCTVFRFCKVAASGHAIFLIEKKYKPYMLTKKIKSEYRNNKKAE